MANQTTPAIQVKDSNVGIGTSSPAYKLDVSGSLNVAANVYNYIGGNKAFGGNGSTFLYLYTGTTALSILNNADSSELVRITNDGNVGIGTTSPAYPLDLGAGGTGNSIRARRIWANGTGTDSGFTLNSTLIYEGASNSFNITNPGSYPNVAFTINNAGNVGIGTTSPGTALEVSGGATAGAAVHIQHTNANGYSGIDFFENTGTFVGSLWHANSGGVASNQNAMTLAARNSGDKVYIVAGGYDPTTSGGITVAAGNVGIGTTSPGERLELAGSNVMLKINASTDTFAQLGYYENGTLKWNTYNNYANDNYQVGNSGGTYFAITPSGNVGIGTTSPSHKLNVAADGYNLRLANTSNAQGYNIGRNISDGYLYFYGDEASYDGYIFSGVGGEKMRITSAGNVGIGTTSPAYKLDIGSNTSETIRISATATSGSTANLLFGSNIITSQAAKIQGIYGGSYDGALAFFTQDAGASDGNRMTEKVRILSNGNVGIGTTSPTAKLNIGSAYDDALVLSDGRSASPGTLFDSSITWDAYYADAARITLTHNDYNTADRRLHFDLSGVEIMSLKSGNVGIGTTAPNQRLSVENGNIQLNANNAAANYYLFINKKTGQDGGILFNRDNNNDWQLSNHSSLGDLVFYSYGTASEAITFKKGTGNVGIGTTNPSYKLQVNADGDGLYVNAAAVSPFTQNIAVFRYGGNGNSVNIENQGGKAAIQARLDNGTAMDLSINAVGGNVGIGTTAPTEILNISRVSTNNYIKVEAGGQASNYSGLMLTEYGINWGWALRHNAATDLLHISYQDNTPTFSDTVTFNRNGNVGIGTTSPSVKLHIVGSSTTELRIQNSDANNNYGFIKYETTVASTGGNIVIGTNASGGGYGAISFSNGNNVEFVGNGDIYLVKSGNVGIGTYSPAQKLHVVGNGLYTGNLDVGHSVSTGDAAINLGTGRTGNGFAYIDLIGDTTYTDYGLRILRNNGGANTTSLIVHRGTGDFSIQNNEAANLVFLTAATERMRISSTGNVGIGTTSPQSKLDIERDSRTGSHPTSLSLYVTGTMGTGNVGGQAGNIEFRHSNASQGIGFGYQAIYQTGDNANEVLNILSKGTGALTLNAYAYSTGNVGIGTASPTEKLHVDGSVVVTYNSSYQGINSVGNKAILARVSPTTGIINYAEYATAANLNGFVMGSDDARVKGNIATDSLEFITNVSERMRITSAGNVGIGTSSPSNILHITNVMRMDNVSASSPNLSSTSAPKYGYGDVSNERYLAEPVIWLKINVGGTEYVIPGYTEVI